MRAKRFRFSFYGQPGYLSWLPWCMKTDFWTLENLIKQSLYIGMMVKDSKVDPEDCLFPDEEMVDASP